jgi:single-strand DNA-binding protein
MESLNSVVLIGRPTKDPELRFTPSGTAVCTFTLAVDRTFKNKDGQKEADFLPIVIWNKLAELTANNVTKGRLIAVSGRIQTRTYEGQDGQKKYITEIIASEVQYLDKKDKQAGQTAPQQTEDNGFPKDEDFFPADPNEDVPF